MKIQLSQFTAKNAIVRTKETKSDLKTTTEQHYSP